MEETEHKRNANNMMEHEDMFDKQTMNQNYLRANQTLQQGHHTCRNQTD